MPTHPTVFISYSWDDEAHKEWVRQLATQLRADGIDARLDHWHAVPGDQLPEFMEREIRDNNYVIIVCTPKYKEKSDKRIGGVGYEGDIMTGEVFTKQNDKKFIPVLAKGSWTESAASWLSGKSYIDLSGDAQYATGYEELRETIFGTRAQPPPLGPLPPGYTPRLYNEPVHRESFERLAEFREYALQRFSKVVTEKKLDIKGIGFLDVALVIDRVSDKKWYNDRNFLSALLIAHPDRHAAWIWKVNQGTDPNLVPYTIAGTYEQLLFVLPAFHRYAFADFSIFDPRGRFFLHKGYFDDLQSDAPESKGQIFDPIVQLLRVSEAFVVGSKYGLALGYNRETRLRFDICWSGLQGRTMASRICPQYDFWSAGECRDEKVHLDLTLSIEASQQEVIQKTTEAIQQLARAFGGYIFPEITVQKEVTRQLNRN
jgi:hypothetical protein